MAKAINAKDKAGRAAGRRKAARRTVVEQLAGRVPRPGQGHRATSSRTSSTASCGTRCSTRASGSTAATSTPSGRSASRPACCRAPTARRSSRGARPRRWWPSPSAPRDDEQRIDSIDVARRDDQVVHAALQLPAVLHRRSEDDPRHQPPRNRARRAGRAGAAAAAAARTRTSPTRSAIVSEILESNGSSSMATVCGGSLALMDAGVPMKAACAGVAMGLIKEGDKVAILTDILGSEDHLGDMDFKVAGTEQGITSIQMDIKIEGLDLEIMEEALEKARKGRLHILEEMAKALAARRAPSCRQYAPRIFTIQIKPDKIGDLIGPKGKTIRGIQDATGAKISVEDTGIVTIAAVGGEAGEKARDMVTAIIAEPEVGKIYEGPVKSTTAVRRVRRDHPGRRGPAPHQRAAARPHREDRGRGQEGRHRQGQAARGGRPRPHEAVPEGAAPEGVVAVRTEQPRRRAVPDHRAERARRPVGDAARRPLGGRRASGCARPARTSPRRRWACPTCSSTWCSRAPSGARARELALELEARGGCLDAFTGRDHTSYQAHVLDADLPLRGGRPHRPGAPSAAARERPRPRAERHPRGDQRRRGHARRPGLRAARRDALARASLRLLDPGHPRDGRRAHARPTSGACTSAATSRATASSRRRATWTTSQLLDGAGAGRAGSRGDAGPAPRRPVAPAPRRAGRGPSEPRDTTQTHIVFGTDTFRCARSAGASRWRS